MIAKILLPPPFDWCPIPAGKVTLIPDEYDKNNSYLKTDTTFDVAAFEMAKYPVTNAQYAKFIAAGGYQDRQWWTEEGWKVCQEGWHYDDGWKPSGKAWTKPRYWEDAKWNEANQPVVSISWYEAVAFCTWLNSVTGDKIMLPTEQQWQRAAQGDDNRVYPWGNDWDSARCRNSVDGARGSAGNTSAVTDYADKGASPFGVVDMAGNVWEWCLTDYKTGQTGLTGTNARCPAWWFLERWQYGGFPCCSP